MVGCSMRLLSKLETYQEYSEYPEFDKIRKRSIDPQALEIKYTGTTPEALAEIGTAMTAEFNGSSKEKTTVKVLTTMANTPGSKYVKFDVAGTLYYAWMKKYQVVTVACDTAANTTSGSYFTIYDSEAAPTGYYVWLDKTGDGTTDKPTVATLTEAVCDISGATTADDIGTIVASVINALAGFGASNASGTVTITHATAGDPTVAPVDVDTDYIITVTQPGGADPSGAGGTGAVCDIKAATTADSIATIIQGVIDAVSGITATVSTDTVTMINDIVGNVTTTETDYATSFTVTQVKAGSDVYEGSPLYFVSTEATDKDAADGHVRKITVIGYANTSEGVLDLKSEEVSLDATAGTTRVESTEKLWTRELHHGATDWGTGDNDAAGAISSQNVDGVASYLVLAAGTNESEACVIWVPADWHVLIPEVDFKLDDTAVVAAIDGGLIELQFSGFDDTKNNRVTNLTPDNDVISYPIGLHQPSISRKWKENLSIPKHGSNVAKITVMNSKVNTAVNIDLRIVFLLWHEAN